MFLILCCFGFVVCSLVWLFLWFLVGHGFVLAWLNGWLLSVLVVGCCWLVCWFLLLLCLLVCLFGWLFGWLVGLFVG